jgi:hypothetical protein
MTARFEVEADGGAGDPVLRRRQMTKRDRHVSGAPQPLCVHGAKGGRCLTRLALCLRVGYVRLKAATPRGGASAGQR